MKLGLMVGYSGRGMQIDIDTILEAERLGYDSVWTAESWGSDAVSPLAWVAAKTTTIRLGTAVMQLPCRTPTNAAMTAMTLDALSGGRFILGLGTSGPQVVEGWHGVPFHKSLTWLREYVEICKKVFAREEALTYEGERFQIPYRGPGSTGQGKPLKSMLHGRKDIPIFTGSMAPKSQEMSAELADGCLLTCMSPEHPKVLMESFERGFAKSGEADKATRFEIVPTVGVRIEDDLEKAYAPFRQQLCLYVGGMGSREKNFYKDYLAKVGFEAECEKIQSLWFAGKRDEALAAVPDAMIDAVHLVGSKARIKDRLQRYRNSPCTTLLVGAADLETLRFVAEANA